MEYVLIITAMESLKGKGNVLHHKEERKNTPLCLQPMSSGGSNKESLTLGSLVPGDLHLNRTLL